ncbi:hypothetical protein VPH35_077972 [Triticum aestivum]
MGPYRIMSFAQRFRRLKLFLQVSTAYVNGQRQGLILEKPFCLGDTITKGIGSSDFSAHQNTMLDIEAEIKLAFDSRRHSSASASVTQEMEELGSRGPNPMVGKTCMCSQRPWARWSSTACEERYRW